MACTDPARLQKDFSISSLKATELKVPVAQCKGIQDTFGFWIPDSRYSILDSFSVGLGFRISIAEGIPDSLSCIPDSKVQDSRFQWQKFPGFRNLNFLTRGDSWIFNICRMTWSSVHFHVFLLTSTYKNILATLSTTGSVVPPWRAENWVKIQASW